MVTSMISAISGLKSHQKKMDVIGNNLANVNTYGFKAGRVVFKDTLYATVNAGSEPWGTNAGINPSQYGYGVQVGSVDVMHQSGAYSQTGAPLDCFIEGDGFFILGKTNGEGTEVAFTDPTQPVTGGASIDDIIDSPNLEVSLTRVGAFNIDKQGNLTFNGKSVYGWNAVIQPELAADGTTVIGIDDATYVAPAPQIDAPGTDQKFGPIKIANAVGGEIVGLHDQFTNIAIEQNGNIKGISGGKSYILGTIAIGTVPNANGLMQSGGTEFETTNISGVLEVGRYQEDGKGSLLSGALELSNVDLTTQFADLITTQRGFQANSKMITTTDEMLQELVNMKR